MDLLIVDTFSKCRLLHSTRSRNYDKCVLKLRFSITHKFGHNTTGSDAFKHLLLFFKRLSDEICYRSYTCLGFIQIQNYVSEFLLKSEHLFFLSKRRRFFFISWAPDHYILLKRG